jgi:hypothetical protein
MDLNKAQAWAKLGLTIIIVVAFCMLASNQWLGYIEKTRLLMTPCELCCKQNPYYQCSRPSFMDTNFSNASIGIINP